MSVYWWALSPRARTSATPPSPGEQNMYCVSGYDEHRPTSRISSSDIGLRRHAIGLSAPLRNAFAATLASVDWVMPYSCM